MFFSGDVEQEDTSSCRTRRPHFLLSKNTSALVDQLLRTPPVNNQKFILLLELILLSFVGASEALTISQAPVSELHILPGYHFLCFCLRLKFRVTD